MKVLRSVACLVCLAAVMGCAKSAHQTGRDVLEKVIPADVLSQVDQTVTFAELRASPETYQGRTVMFGGVALKSRRVKNQTEIEVMQLPTGANMQPSERRKKSEGRFLAVQKDEFLDPATIEEGTLVTVVGQVQGASTKALDESDYTYPVIEISYLVDWNEIEPPQRRGYVGYYGGYYGGPYWPWYGPYSYWGPYGAYPYYYGPYFVQPFGFSSPAPSPPPPPSSVPPQFKK